MTFEEKRDEIAERNPDALLADGFEEALIGVVRCFGKDPVALYDYWACVGVLTAGGKLTDEEAIEYLEFNTLGAWAGEGTPAYAYLFKDA